MKMLFAILFWSNLAFAQNDFSQTEKFRNFSNTEIALGEYILKSGPSRCRQGPLEIVESESDFSLELGNHALVLSLGRGGYDTESDESGCSSKVVTKIDKKEINSHYKQTCKDGTIESKIKVKKTKKGFTYSVEAFRGKKRTSKDKCELEFAEKTQGADSQD